MFPVREKRFDYVEVKNPISSLGKAARALAKRAQRGSKFERGVMNRILGRKKKTKP